MMEQEKRYTIRQLGLRKTGINTSKAICYEFDARMDGKEFPIMIWLPSKFMAPPENTRINTWATQIVRTKINEAASNFIADYKRGLYNDDHARHN